MDADRNLLTGILALQLDFVARPTLINAVNTWVLDKPKSLGQILLEQGAITAEEHELLEALVEAHLRKHGGDPKASLESLTPIGAAREELEAISDPQLCASLRSVTATWDEAQAGDTAGDWEVGDRTASGRRFRVLRPCAEGGLGKVWLALDEELHREVALKEIHPRHAGDPESRRRFVQEAEVTGALEHPGVVPVYGLGSYADGRPFYAMRFIRGRTFKHAIEEFHSGGEGGRGVSVWSLEFRQLLGRFIDVCNAIEYAHSRGVLHRDLKPGNIMLGKYGETLVVDWGLAKPQGAEAASDDATEGPIVPSPETAPTETAPGKAMGTPQYMSPEQAAGELGKLGPATDVYSLGVTLYCVLTGRAPFEGSTAAEVMAKVRRGEFPRPREVRANVPRPLAAVCLKAMELVPSERYRSPRQLADDVEHWLADEPLSAYTEPLHVRARRWARRHQTQVTAAAVAALVALASLGVGVELLRTKNVELSQAWGEAERRSGLLAMANKELVKARDAAQERSELLAAANRELEAARDEAKRQSELLAVTNQELKQARDRAQQRSELLEVANRELEKATKSAEERSRLLATANRELEEAKKQALERSELLATSNKELAEARDEAQRQAELLRVANQELAQARDAAQERSELLATANRELGEARDLARKRYGLALEAIEKFYTGVSEDVLLKEERLRDLRKRLLEVPRDFYERLTDELADSEEPSQRHALARACMALADITDNIGSKADALVLYQRAVGVLQDLLEQDPTTTDYRAQLAIGHTRLASLQHAVGEVDEALASYEKGIELHEALLAENPQSTLHRDELARSHGGLGRLHSDLGNYEEAIALFARAYEVKGEAFEGDGDGAPGEAAPLAPYASVLKWLEEEMAKCELDGVELAFETGIPGSAAPAESAFRKVVGIEGLWRALEAQMLPSERPDSAVGDDRIRAYLAQAKGKYSNASGLYQNAIRRLEALVAAHPTITRYQQELAAAHSDLGFLQRLKGKEDDALESLTRAISIQRQLVAADPGVPEYVRGLARSHARLGVLQAQGKDRRAEESLERAATLGETLVADDSTISGSSVARFYHELLGYYGTLADLAVAGGQLDGALGWCEKGVAIGGRLVAKYPDVRRFRAGLALSRLRVALLKERGGAHDDALAAYREAVEIGEGLLREQPTSAKARVALAMKYWRLGDLQHRMGVLDGATQNCQTAIELMEQLVAERPGVGWYRYRLAWMCNKLALRQRGRGGQVQLYARGIKLLEDMVSGEGNTFQQKLALAAYCANQCGALLAEGEYLDALEVSARAIGLFAELADGGPAKQKSMAFLAGCHVNRGKVLARLGRGDEAFTESQKAVEICDRLLTRAPSDPQQRRRLASTYYDLGGLQREANKGQDAIASYQKAAALYEQAIQVRNQLVAVDPTTEEHRDRLGRTHYDLGAVRFAQRQYAEASACYGTAIEIREALLAGSPADATHQNALADSHLQLGRSQWAAGELDGALESLRRAGGAYAQLVAEQPDVSPYRRGLASSCYNAGDVQRRAGQPEDAIAWHGKAIAEYERLIAGPDCTPDDRKWLSCSYHWLGLIQRDLGNPAAAEESLRRAIELQTKLVGDSPSVEDYAKELGLTYCNLAALQRANGATEGATASWLRARDIYERLVAEKPDRPEFREALARVHNALAWQWVACADETLRRPGDAVEFARKAVADSPETGNYWNTLGVAQYRAGNWEGGLKALGKSVDLRSGGDGYDFFFLAMSHWQLGSKGEAREWHGKAIEWMDKNKPDDEELKRFRAEAEALLTIPAP